jgi:hypothetical protein
MRFRVDLSNKLDLPRFWFFLSIRAVYLLESQPDFTLQAGNAIAKTAMIRPKSKDDFFIFFIFKIKQMVKSS